MRTSKSVSVVLATATVISLGACTGKSDERKYSLPDSLCGTSIPEKKYDSLFPPGEKVSTEEFKRWGAGEEGDTEGCRYYVDGDRRLDIFGKWVNSEYGDMYPVRSAELIEKYHEEKGKKYPGRFDVWTSRSGAAATVDCSFEEEEPAELNLDRYVLELSTGKHEFNGDRDEAHKVFGELARSVMADVLPKLPCKES